MFSLCVTVLLFIASTTAEECISHESEYYFGMEKILTFYDADLYCRSHGMKLVSIETAEENARLLDLIKKLGYLAQRFWTSGNDIQMEKAFHWSSTGQPFQFTYWSPKQPDNTNRIEHCVEMWQGSGGNHTWNDDNCLTEKNFICEYRRIYSK